MTVDSHSTDSHGGIPQGVPQESPYQAISPPEPGIERRSLSLSLAERETLQNMAGDTGLSRNLRARAHALLLLAEGMTGSVIENRTGLTLDDQSKLLAKAAGGGIPAALSIQAKHTRKVSRFPAELVADTLRATLKRRPPEGSTKWDLRKLTAVVRAQVLGAETISTESVRTILKKHLGIDSIRRIEPFWLTQVRKAESHHHH